MQNNWLKAEKVLKEGGIAVIPTDTLYGLVASAFDKKAIEKIQRIKERDKIKVLIVLISSLKDLEKFGIKTNKEQAKILEKFWPGAVSVLLSCKSNKFKYIHRDTEEIAFRMIGKKHKNLFNLLKKVGPLVAPSVNKESERPAETIKEAKEYFGDKVDCYINSGKKVREPSTLIRVKEGKIDVLRQGRVFLI